MIRTLPAARFALLLSAFVVVAVVGVVDGQPFPRCTKCWCVHRNRKPQGPACPPLRKRELFDPTDPTPWFGKIALYFFRHQLEPGSEVPTLLPAGCIPEFPAVAEVLEPLPPGSHFCELGSSSTRRELKKKIGGGKAPVVAKKKATTTTKKKATTKKKVTTKKKATTKEKKATTTKKNQANGKGKGNKKTNGAQALASAAKKKKKNLKLLQTKNTKTGQDTQVCAFKYSSDDEGCQLSGAPRQYRVKTYKNKGQAEADKAVITHYGRCGVCSTAQNLAVFLHPALDLISADCGQRWIGAGGIPDIANLPLVLGCFMNMEASTGITGFGLSQDCAMVWTFNSLNTGIACWDSPCKDPEGNDVDRCCEEALTSTPPWAPNHPDTCDINDCLKCDEDNSGPTFKGLSGRTRRLSGIVTPAVKRPCKSIANLRQDPCATRN